MVKDLDYGVERVRFKPGRGFFLWYTSDTFKRVKGCEVVRPRGVVTKVQLMVRKVPERGDFSGVS